MMITKSVRQLVNMRDGLISRQIFVDEAIYRQELERMFTTCWLFLGHESQILTPGDYMTNYMGEDLSSSVAMRKGGYVPFSTLVAIAA